MKNTRLAEKFFAFLCLAATASVGVYYMLVMATVVEYQSPYEGKYTNLLLAKKVTSPHGPFLSRNRGNMANGSRSGDIKDLRNSKFGYLVALKYYEQQTQAAKNFLQLQCLAKSYGMRVVEPFIHLSSISFPFSEISETKVPLRYSDLINMEYWNYQTKNYGYESVSKWEEFLDNAPRDVVIVCIHYRDPPLIPVPLPGHNYRVGCKETCYNKFNSSLTFLERHQFRLVRKVCANFAGYAGSVTDKSFENNIFGNLKHEQVTVLFNEFRGFFGLYRMQVLSSCGLKHSNMNMSITPSLRLVKEVRNYTTKNFKSRPYASILVRVEKLILHSHRNLTQCAEEVLVILQRLRKERNLSDYFLAMDVGRFGSHGSSIHNLQPFGESFFRYIYPTKWSFDDWENSFSSSASSLNPAYIANFQRTMATRGDCLIMVGMGGFQAQTRTLYYRYHEGRGGHCVYTVCHEPILPGVT